MSVLIRMFLSCWQKASWMNNILSVDLFRLVWFTTFSFLNLRLYVWLHGHVKREARLVRIKTRVTLFSYIYWRSNVLKCSVMLMVKKMTMHKSNKDTDKSDCMSDSSSCLFVLLWAVHCHSVVSWGPVRMRYSTGKGCFKQSDVVDFLVEFMMILIGHHQIELSWIQNMS